MRVSEVNDWITKTVCKEVGELCPKSKSGKSGKNEKGGKCGKCLKSGKRDMTRGQTPNFLI